MVGKSPGGLEAGQGTAGYSETAETVGSLCDDRGDRELLEKLGGLQGIAAIVQSSTTGGIPNTESEYQARKDHFGTNRRDVPPHKTLWALCLEAANDLTLKILAVAAIGSILLQGSFEGWDTGWYEVSYVATLPTTKL